MTWSIVLVLWWPQRWFQKNALGVVSSLCRILMGISTLERTPPQNEARKMKHLSNLKLYDSSSETIVVNNYILPSKPLLLRFVPTAATGATISLQSASWTSLSISRCNCSWNLVVWFAEMSSPGDCFCWQYFRHSTISSSHLLPYRDSKLLSFATTCFAEFNLDGVATVS